MLFVRGCCEKKGANKRRVCARKGPVPKKDVCKRRCGRCAEKKGLCNRRLCIRIALCVKERCVHVIKGCTRSVFKRWVCIGKGCVRERCEKEGGAQENGA
jgi:hypothetical protein